MLLWILAERERLHRLVRQTLSERELHDGLLFAACALIVLPLVPDKGFGPHGALNPSVIWRLVVIVMALKPRAMWPCGRSDLATD